MKCPAIPAITLMLTAWAAACDAGAAESAESIAARLEEAPPRAPHTEARNAALKGLDEWIARPDSERMPEVVGYYQRALDHALAVLESERPSSGIRYVQLYSSSAVIQTPGVTFAFDLDQGPNSEFPALRPDEDVPFRMTQEQVERLARCVDCVFFTHEHDDHVDRAIVEAFAAQGKTMYVTESMKRLSEGEPWADRFEVLEQTVDRPHRIGDLQVDVLWDHQWNNAAHTSGTPCNAYVVTTPDGLSVCTKGDINCGLQFLGWLTLLARQERHVDLMVGSCIYWRGVNTMREIDRLLSPLWAPGHAWEFTHRPRGEARGNAAPYLTFYSAASLYAGPERTLVLSWGEHFDLPAPLKRQERD